MPLLEWILSPIGRYFAIAFAAVVIIAGLYFNIRASIRGDMEAEVAEQTLERITNAIRAGDAVSTDPLGVRTNDGHCRDC